MSTSRNETGIVASPFGTINESKSPQLKQIRLSAEEAMDFQLWTSAQATSLAKLKVFHTMAKQVNDQQ